jgi:hypothetical protein
MGFRLATKTHISEYDRPAVLALAEAHIVENYSLTVTRAAETNILVDHGPAVI